VLTLVALLVVQVQLCAGFTSIDRQLTALEQGVSSIEEHLASIEERAGAIERHQAEDQGLRRTVP
jgi:hypothetical protein